jgi:hypothetical protein
LIFDTKLQPNALSLSKPSLIEAVVRRAVCMTSQT